MYTHMSTHIHAYTHTHILMKTYIQMYVYIEGLLCGESKQVNAIECLRDICYFRLLVREGP